MEVESNRREDTIELRSTTGPESRWDDGPHQGPDFSLPRADGGYQAWGVLAACFLMEALVWGFPFAFGVFQRYYTTHEPFASNSSGVAVIGTTATGIMYIAAPFAFVLFQAYPQHRRKLSVAGFIIILASFIGASFASTIPVLLATQGVLYAIGGLILYFPAIQYLDEWFIRRKGFAYGIMWAGTGVSGIVTPLLLDWMLNTWGHRVTFRAWAGIVFILVSPCLFFLKPRLPNSGATAGFRKIDFSYLATAPFWYLQIGNIAQGLGYFLPTLYLPSYARTVGLSTLTGTLAISLVHVGAVLGAVTFGSLTDRTQLHITTTLLLSAVGSFLSIFLFWGFAVSQALLFVFAIAYGIFSGGYASCWTGMGRVLKGRAGVSVDTGMIIALFAAGKGLGSVVSGPLSEALIRSDTWEGKAEWAYGTGYGGVVVFSGCAMALGGFGCLGRLTRAL